MDSLSQQLRAWVYKQGARLHFSLLSSGSRANCIFVTDGVTRILVDCGLSARQVEKRLEILGFSAQDIDAIVVTHEHSDHVAGVGVFYRKYKVPVYSNRATREASPKLIEVPEESWVEICEDQKFSIGGLTFAPFPIEHDASEPIAFRISDSLGSLGIVTDLGQKTSFVMDRIRGVDALVIESNHDLDMLYDSPYPWSIKQRIQGRKGHLRNEQAAEILCDSSSNLMNSLQIVVAAHISENSNTSDRAIEVLRQAWISAGGRSCQNFVAATAEKPTELFSIK